MYDKAKYSNIKTRPEVSNICGMPQPAAPDNRELELTCSRLDTAASSLTRAAANPDTTVSSIEEALDALKILVEETVTKILRHHESI